MLKFLGVFVIPCYNEASRFNITYFTELLRELNNFEKDINIKFLFINDGSTDQTFAKLQTISHLENVMILTLETNLGKANAIRLGLIKAGSLNPNFVAYLDADGAFSVASVIEGVNLYMHMGKNKEIDMMTFARIKLSGNHILRKKHRHIIGRFIAFLLNLNSEIKVYDSQSGFKILSSKFLDPKVIAKPFKTRWFIDWELIVRNKVPLHILEVPVMYWSDVANSKITVKNSLRVFREIIIIKKLQMSGGPDGSN